jgi:hypothetical protein
MEVCYDSRSHYRNTFVDFYKIQQHFLSPTLAKASMFLAHMPVLPAAVGEQLVG